MDTIGFYYKDSDHVTERLELKISSDASIDEFCRLCAIFARVCGYQESSIKKVFCYEDY